MCKTCNGTGVTHDVIDSAYLLTGCPDCTPYPQSYFDDLYDESMAKLDALERCSA